MDEGDDYVPQISQLESDGPGGYPFASDLSADAYVPPPPGPNGGQSQSVYAMQQQHQPPPQFYHNQPQQSGMGPGTFAPPPPQPMPPPAPAKSKGKKKKQPQQQVQEQPLPPPQHFAQPQQQQSPYPSQPGHSQWNAYNPRTPYIAADQQQHYAQQVNYPSVYNGGYAEQQQMPQGNFYQQRPSQPSSYYVGQQQQQQQQQQQPRMHYPGYPPNPMQQQQHYYPQQQQQQQPASHYAGHGYPTQQVQPAQRFNQPWSQQQQSQQYQQNAAYPPSHQYSQPMPQQLAAPRQANSAAPAQWQQLQMDMQRCQEQFQMLSQQQQTPQVQQQAQNLQQRMHYLRSQMQSMQQQQQQQQQCQQPPAAAPPPMSMTSPVHLQQQPYGGQNAPSYMQQQSTSVPIPSQVDQQQHLGPSGRAGMTSTNHTLQKSPLTPPPPPPAPPMMSTTVHSQPASAMHSSVSRAPMNAPRTEMGECSTTTVSSSMSVMQRGPEVQVNIKPEAQSTTLISVYQYPGAPPTGPHHNHQQASVAIQPLPADNHNFVVPPEPEPPAPKQPVIAPPPPIITELQSPPRKPPVSTSQKSPKASKTPKTAVLSPPPFPAISPTPLVEEPPNPVPDEEEPLPEEEKPATKPKPKRRPARKAKTKKEPPPLPPPVVDQEEESSTLDPPAEEAEPVEETKASTPVAVAEIADTDVSRLSNDSAESVESEAPKPKKKKAAPKKSSTESKSKKQKFATKKSSKSRKRKRLSYESEASGDEAAKDIVAAIVDEIPESLVEKRRSSRVTKRRRYEDSENFPDLSDEEHLLPNKDEPLVEMEAARVEDQMVVEKIMLMRTVKKAKDTDKEDDEETADDTELEQFYCKFKNFSYLHCEWKSQEELEKGDRRVVQKIKRFKQRREHATTILDEQYDEDEPFNPDYIQVERVLDVAISEVPIEDDTTAAPKVADKDKAEKSADTQEDSAEDKSADDAEAVKETSSDAKEKDAKEKDSKEKDTKEKDAKEKDSKEKDAKEKDSKEKDTEAADPEAEQPAASPAVDDGAETAKSPAPPATKTQTHYLVKWRSLQYEDSTWELEKDVDKDKIAEFEARRYPKPERTKDKPRPQSSDWRKMDDNPAFKNDNQLRDYQVEGLNWLLFCWYNKQNCILADEMGLGKTIQTITFLVKVQEAGVTGPFLVVAPLSTIHNWEREFETWSDINAVVYHGTSASRHMIREYEMYFQEEGERVKKPYKFDALITTFEMVLADCDELKEIPFRMCIIDEAHRLKNRNCKLLTGGFSAFQMEHRVLLTGTPLQNNIDELFSLLNFLEPKQFASSEAFLSEFGQCQTDDQVNKLQEILKPMMLRRLKEDVEKALKPKEETIIEVELSNIQKKYYRAILERNFSYLCKGASAPSLMNTMMELRKCCNHPFLINGAEEQIVAEQKVTNPNAEPDELTHTALVQSSGKLVLIDKLLPKLRQDGHKVLIFSQMVRVLDLIEEYLVHMKYSMERIDGNVRGDLRQAAIDRFSKPDSDRFIFLLCTRAGGLGINLTAADTVIIFDSDWNPQNDLQAQARCHRIGQQKSVKVYRLITRNTYEREMFDKASLKLGLDKAVLQSMGTKDNMAAQLSKKEVEELLRKGAYGAVMDETNEDSKFSEEDIDTILQRRTQTVTIQAGIKGSTFAKASFNVSSNREDIDVNDPNFWAKWAKRAGVDPDFNPDKELILYEPRQRKRRFDEEVYKNMEEEDSDSDSDDSHKGKKRMSKRRRGVDGDATYTPDELAFNKTDYFKVEKNLGVYGWGRWKEIRENCDFKQLLTDDDIEHMCRTLLLHCVREFSGDEKIREFAWELVTPLDAEIVQPDANAQRRKKTPAKSGSRKSSRIHNKDEEEENDLNSVYHQGWAALPAYNPPALAVDCSYQRHLQRHANKVLLRIRLLYFLNHEVIGALAERVLSGALATELDLVVPWHPELPVDWWDQEADKSLLIGIFKHGFENFAAMRDDPALCFLKRCGHSEFFGSEQQSKDDAEPEANESDRNPDEPDANEQPKEPLQKDDDDGGKSKKGNKKEAATEEKMEEEAKVNEPTTTAETSADSGLLPFPSTSELNARFRRLMTLYQRSSKLSSLREEQKAKRSARQVHIQTLLQEREVRRLEERQRWTRREETDFYRTLSMYGVAQDPDTAEYRWDTFKKLARLESKFDQTLTDYATAFLAMCKRMCRRPLSGVEESLSWIPESVSEERANKVLQRVEFLNRVRAAVRHPRLRDRIQLCKRTPDLPPWWEPGIPHDLDLLKGVAEHGLYKTEENILHDPKLSFASIYRAIKKELAAERAVTRSAARTAVGDEAHTDGVDTVKQETGGDTAKPDDVKPKTELVDGDGPTSEEPKKPEEKAGPVEEKAGRVEEEAKEAKTSTATTNGSSKTKEETNDADQTVAQILAEQSGNVLQWPKERMIIFRLQNVCMAIEHAEWPSTMNTRGLGSGSSDVDQRSTPDDTPRETPSLFDESRDSPLAAMFGAGRAMTPKSRRSRKPKNALVSQANPLQDLMEAEKEKMRALMHQSFLQQIEQFPFAAAMAASGFGQPQLGGMGLAGFPTVSQIQELGLASLFGMPSASTNSTAPSGSSSNVAASNSKAAASSAAGDEALNLSTKNKKNDQPAQQKPSSAKKQQQQLEDGGLPLQEMLALANLPADSRMAVINLKDGSRLTGKEAPTLRSLAQWLSAHPDYVLDLPRPDAIHDLEPGEIPKAKEKVVKSADKSVEQHVSVVNRKNPQLTLNGSKGPTLKNLAIWLQKNPDWDIDPSSVSLVKSKVKLPDNLKSRLRQPDTPKSASNKTPATPAMPATSTAQSNMSFDPFGGLFPAGLDAATQLQMQMMMMQNPFANPSLLSMGLGGFPGAFAFPGMMPNSLGLNGMAGLSSSATTTTATPTSTNSSSRMADSEKKSAKEPKKASAVSSSSSSAADKKDPLADNPFLAAMGMAGLATSNAGSSAGGIFGLNPFMAASMQPGMSPNLALAQLQSLIGMQGLDSLMAASFPGFPAVSSVGSTQSTPSRKTTTSSSSSKPVVDTKSSKDKGGRSTSSSNVRSSGSATGANSKLNALVDKLAAAKSDSPAPGKNDDDNDEGRM